MRGRKGPARLCPSIVMGALLCLGGCDRPEPRGAPVVERIEVVDDAGRTVVLSAPARRVVSLIPAHTDLIIALGAADRLVARTRFDLDPAVAGLPALDDALTPSVEWLLRLNPDLVLAWADGSSRTVVERLSALGVPVYSSRVEALAEFRRGAGSIGALLGLRNEADSLVAAIDSALAAARNAVSGLERPAVLYLIGLDPPIAAGPDSFVDELLDIAGGRNVMRDAAARWPPVSMEEVVARQPEVVIVAAGRAHEEEVVERLRAMPGMRTLEAVSNGRVHVVDADLFNRPGPGLAEAVRVLAAAIHPGTPP